MSSRQGQPCQQYPRHEGQRDDHANLAGDEPGGLGSAATAQPGQCEFCAALVHAYGDDHAQQDDHDDGQLRDERRDDHPRLPAPLLDGVEQLREPGGKSGTRRVADRVRRGDLRLDAGDRRSQRPEVTEAQRSGDHQQVDVGKVTRLAADLSAVRLAERGDRRGADEHRVELGYVAGIVDGDGGEAGRRLIGCVEPVGSSGRDTR